MGHEMGHGSAHSQKLTQRLVNEISPSGAKLRIADHEVRGLFLRVMPSGAKSYVVRISKDGRRGEAAIGDARSITLAAARARAVDALSDLAAGNDHFFAATGITQGDFLRGVRYTATGAITHSLVTRSRSGTWRTIEAHHRWDKLMTYSEVAYR